MNLVRLRVLLEHFEEIGDYEMAESLVRQLIAYKEREFGADARELISDLYNLALLLEVQEHRTEALHCAKRVYKLAADHKCFDVVDITELKNLIGLPLVDNIA